MNERCLSYHLVTEGYTEDEIENHLSEIAEDMNDSRRDDEETEKTK